MSRRDYAHRAHGKTLSYPWYQKLMLATLLLLIIFVGSYLWFNKEGVAQNEANLQQSDVVVSADTSGGQEKNPSKPRFEFYQILPSVEVASTQYAKEEVPLYARPEHQDGRFVLQIASFRRLNDAKRLQKTLMELLQVKTSILETKRSSGSVWYRLHTDEYTNRHLAEIDRAKLIKHRYKALLLKR